MMMTLCNDSDDDTHESNGRTLRHAIGKTGGCKLGFPSRLPPFRLPPPPPPHLLEPIRSHITSQPLTARARAPRLERSRCRCRRPCAWRAMRRRERSRLEERQRPRGMFCFFLLFFLFFVFLFVFFLQGTPDCFCGSRGKPKGRAANFGGAPSFRPPMFCLSFLHVLFQAGVGVTTLKQRPFGNKWLLNLPKVWRPFGQGGSSQEADSEDCLKISGNSRALKKQVFFGLCFPIDFHLIFLWLSLGLVFP